MHPSLDVPDTYDLLVRHALAFADAVSRTLRVARVLVEADREISLDGLQNTVGLLCARTLDLPPERGASLRGRLAELRDETDALSAAMAARSGGAAWTIQGKRP
jgi:hypothetical protein